MVLIDMGIYTDVRRYVCFRPLAGIMVLISKRLQRDKRG